MTIFSFRRGAILPIVLGLGVILFIYLASFLLYFQRESRLAYQYSSQIAAQKLAEAGMTVFHQLAKSKLRDPGFTITRELKKPLAEMEEASEPVDLEEPFKPLLKKINSLKAAHFNVQKWEGTISVHPDDFEAFDYPLAKYAGGNYEKHGLLRLTVTATVGIEGSAFATVEGIACEVTEVKVNIASIPLLADFTLFVQNARATGSLNRTELDEDGFHTGGAAPIVLVNGNLPIGPWRAPIKNDLFTREQLGNQGWVYLGSGYGNTAAVVLKPAFRIPDQLPQNGEAYDERFTFYCGPADNDPKYSNDMFNEKMVPEAAKLDPPADFIEDDYELYHMNLGVLGRPTAPSPELSDFMDYLKPVGEPEPMLGYKSSTLKPFGTEAGISPTIVFGNVIRKYMFLSWVMVPEAKSDGTTLPNYTDWTTIINECFEAVMNTDYSTGSMDTAEKVIDRCQFASLPRCSTAGQHASLESQDEYKFIFEYTGPLLNDFDEYRKWMTQVAAARHVNRALDLMARSGSVRKPASVLGEGSGYYQGDLPKCHQYPREFEHGVKPGSGGRDLYQIFSKIDQHLGIGGQTTSYAPRYPRTAWNALGGMTQFLEDYGFLQQYGGETILNLGTVVYSPTAGKIGPIHEIKRGGILVFKDKVTVTGPISPGAGGGVLTIVSLTGDITLKYNDPGSINAQLVALDGTVRAGSGQISLRGAMAVKKLSLTSLSERSYISYNPSLKRTPDQEQDPDDQIGLLLVDIRPVGDPVPSSTQEVDAP